MANEYTLYDYQLTANPITAAVVKTWREASKVLDLLSFKTSDQLTQEFLTFGTLPTVPWRKIGEDFTQVKVNPIPMKERLHFMGAKIDVPYEYVKAGSMLDIRAEQSEAMMRAAAIGFDTSFWRNTPTADEDAIVGMWYRIHNMLPATQKFSAGIDVSADSSLTNANNRLVDVVEDLLSRVDGDDSEKCLFMGKTLYQRFRSLLRQSITWSDPDNYGRKFLTFQGAKIFEAGYQVDQSTQILTDVETANTSLTSGAVSSMYCLKFGGNGIGGWCQEMPMAEDVGLIEARTHYRTVVRFSPGIYMPNLRCAAVAYSFTAA